MENKVKGATFLEMLFVAFLIFKIVGVSPISGWSYFGLVAVPIYIQIVKNFLVLIWVKMGYREEFYGAVEMRKYNRDLKKATGHFQNINNEENAARVENIKRKIAESNAANERFKKSAKE